VSYRPRSTGLSPRAIWSEERRIAEADKRRDPEQQVLETTIEQKLRTAKGTVITNGRFWGCGVVQTHTFTDRSDVLVAANHEYEKLGPTLVIDAPRVEQGYLRMRLAMVNSVIGEYLHVFARRGASIFRVSSHAVRSDAIVFLESSRSMRLCRLIEINSSVASVFPNGDIALSEFMAFVTFSEGKVLFVADTVVANTEVYGPPSGDFVFTDIRPTLATTDGEVFTLLFGPYVDDRGRLTMKMVPSISLIVHSVNQQLRVIFRYRDEEVELGRLYCHEVYGDQHGDSPLTSCRLAPVELAHLCQTPIVLSRPSTPPQIIEVIAEGFNSLLPPGPVSLSCFVLKSCNDDE
jgi:hypothetical protein